MAIKALNSIPTCKLGCRLGNWLTAEEARTLWQLPDPATLKGKRDRAILALLLGCGLVGEDVAAITACVAETVLQENWLDGVFENIEIERLGPNIFDGLLWRFVLAAGPHCERRGRQCQCAREERPLCGVTHGKLTCVE